jgi:hypothetical protein
MLHMQIFDLRKEHEDTVDMLEKRLTELKVRGCFF